MPELTGQDYRNYIRGAEVGEFPFEDGNGVMESYGQLIRIARNLDTEFQSGKENETMVENARDIYAEMWINQFQEP